MALLKHTKLMFFNTEMNLDPCKQYSKVIFMIMLFGKVSMNCYLYLSSIPATLTLQPTHLPVKYANTFSLFISLDYFCMPAGRCMF